MSSKKNDKYAPKGDSATKIAKMEAKQAKRLRKLKRKEEKGEKVKYKVATSFEQNKKESQTRETRESKTQTTYVPISIQDVSRPRPIRIRLNPETGGDSVVWSPSKIEFDQMNKFARLKCTKACVNVVGKRGDVGEYGVCTRVGCTFAHGLDEYNIAQCLYGEKCRRKASCTFKHPQETDSDYFDRTRSVPPDLPYESEKYYKPEHSVPVLTPVSEHPEENDDVGETAKEIAMLHISAGLVPSSVRVW